MAGMLVSPVWLQKVDDHINAEEPTKRLKEQDVFYGVRPAKLTSAWSSGKATANLIINGVESTSIDVYDVTGQADSVGLTTGNYCYVAYRGQWEIISSFVQGGGGSVAVSTVSAISHTGSVDPLYTLANGVVVCDPLADSTYVLASGDTVVYMPYSGSDYQGIIIQAEPLS